MVRADELGSGEELYFRSHGLGWRSDSLHYDPEDERLAVSRIDHPVVFLAHTSWDRGQSQVRRLRLCNQHERQESKARFITIPCAVRCASTQAWSLHRIKPAESQFLGALGSNGGAGSLWIESILRLHEVDLSRDNAPSGVLSDPDFKNPLVAIHEPPHHSVTVDVYLFPLNLVRRLRLFRF